MFNKSFFVSFFIILTLCFVATAAPNKPVRNPDRNGGEPRTPSGPDDRHDDNPDYTPDRRGNDDPDSCRDTFGGGSPFSRDFTSNFNSDVLSLRELVKKTKNQIIIQLPGASIIENQDTSDEQALIEANTARVKMTKLIEAERAQLCAFAYEGEDISFNSELNKFCLK